MIDYLSHMQGKDYQHFWMKLYSTWFVKWPEHDLALLGIQGALTIEQEAILGKAIDAQKNVSIWGVYAKCY